MLDRRRILIAEDEAFIAFELATAVENAGGQVVGPVASVSEGLRLLDREDVDAAILDVRLIDRDVTPIATLLLNVAGPSSFIPLLRFRRNSSPASGLPPSAQNRCRRTSS